MSTFALLLSAWLGIAVSVAPVMASQAAVSEKETVVETPAAGLRSPPSKGKPEITRSGTNAFTAMSAKEMSEREISQPDVGNGVIQVTLGLLVVLSIIAAAAWFTRRFGQFQSTAGGALRIIGGLHLGTRERLVIVQVGEEQVLLGVAPGRVSKLHVLSNPIVGSEPDKSAHGTFLDKLNAALKKDRK